MTIEKILATLNLRKEHYDDFHITRMFSSFAAVSSGKVLALTDPTMNHCPLFSLFYRRPSAAKTMKKQIRTAIQTKIEQFGSFTDLRNLSRDHIAVPFGASEMMMFALNKEVIDATVTVCDGAGTVIATDPTLVQGIGARMNGLFYTTPIPAIIRGIEGRGGTVVFPDTATIDQVKGLKAAARRGYKRIAVTVNGFANQDIMTFRALEREYNISVVVIIVCTTGVTKERIDHIADYADVVWTCGSETVRERAGKRTLLQITTGIPVFVLTANGLTFVSAYCNDPAIIQNLDPAKQHLIAGHIKGVPVTMGTTDTYLSEAQLPVLSKSSPR